MSRMDSLPPDQRAALSLLLSQRKSYAEVATLLHIPAGAVHDRAQAALAVLAPREARSLTPDERAEVGDYLLGQTGIAERLKTRTYLSDSEAARTWALAVSSALAELTPNALPEIPAPEANNVHLHQDTLAPPAAVASSTAAAAPPIAAEAAGAPPSAPPARPAPSSPSSSRLGGILILAAVIVAVVVAVILLTGGSSSKHKGTSSPSRTTAANTHGPTVHQLTLRSPSAGSRSLGVVEVLSEAGKRAFYIEAQNLPESKHFFYAVWLYNSPSSAEPLSKAPPVGKTHRLAGGALLPADAGKYSHLLLTRETSSHPAKPGKVVLSGPFSLE